MLSNLYDRRTVSPVVEKKYEELVKLYNPWEWNSPEALDVIKALKIVKDILFDDTRKFSVRKGGRANSPDIDWDLLDNA